MVQHVYPDIWRLCSHLDAGTILGGGCVSDNEVLIIGAGAAGAIAARTLATAGIKVTCLEQGEWTDDSRLYGRRTEWELLSHQRWDANPNIRLAESDYPVEVTESDVNVLM